MKTTICPEHAASLKVIALWLDQMLAPCPPHDLDDALGYALAITLREHPSIQAVREAGWKETDRA